MLFGVIGVIGVLASVVGVWAHRTVFNSETVADAVDQALLNPEVNEALATFLTDQLVDAVPLEDLIADRVPDELEPFTPVLVGGVRNVVHEGMTRVLEDGRAREALVAVVERAHEAVMRVLEGDGLRDGVTVEGEDIKVNLLPLLSRGLERLQDRGILTSVDLPELTADGDPEEQIAELEDALDRDLPDDFGQLVVYSSDNVAESQAAVARAQDAFALFRRSIIALVVLTVVSLGVSAALATNRRRAAIALLLSVVAALLVGRVLVRTVVEEAPNLARQARWPRRARGDGDLAHRRAAAARQRRAPHRRRPRAGRLPPRQRARHDAASGARRRPGPARGAWSTSTATPP